MGPEQPDHSSQFRNGAYAQFAVFFPTRAGQLGSRGNALRAGWDGSDPEKFMANEEHVDRLKQDVKAWNEWRSYSPIAPDLREAKLAGMDLRTSWLVEADLGRADLKGTDLSGSAFGPVNLSEADLSGATLTGADLSGANLSRTYMWGANLSQANLREANLSDTNLTKANLREASLILAHLRFTNLHEADLTRATLFEANLFKTDPANANLNQTILVGIDFTHTKGMETCTHGDSSFIDLQTLQKSGPLPLAFLRGIGLSDDLIACLPSLLNQQPLKS
jgi:uncharacterized protein YjbI with pentapeptide repeats